MSTNVHASQVLKSPLMLELRNAFGHIPSVAHAFRTNNYEFFFGCDVDMFATGGISFEEYFCRNILKKVQNVDVPGVDPKVNAIEAFKQFLDVQDVTSHRVSYSIRSADKTTSVGRCLFRARDILHSLLGGFTGVEVKPRFTSGASTELNRLQGSNPYNRVRVSSGWDVVSDNLTKYYTDLGLSSFDLADLLPGIAGDRTWHTLIDFVPKTWKIDRVIGRQPTTALAVQAGVGDYLMQRARTVGLDITTAQDRHKELARLSSLMNDHLMTLDQSNASDNILRSVVEFLLPSRLYRYMTCITPDSIEFEGMRRHVHMMAPAGNGYIFPLQTLIFWAITKSVCIECKVKPEVYSYGDDLIAPKSIYRQLKIVFDILGFQINQGKTFADGHFRESCGGDYLLGGNVRPFYVKRIPTSTLEWIRCVNGIRRVGWHNNLSDWRTNNFRRFWLWCIAHIPANDRLFAPRHYGDAAISTECEQLYRLTYKTTYYRDGRRYKYPNNGLHSSGHPYSGWYIETYVHQSTGEGGFSFGDAVKGIPADLTLRVISLASVKGSGLRLKKVSFDKKTGQKLTQPLLKLGYLPFFEMDDYRVSRIRTPYFACPPAPNENMDELFSHLGSENPITDSDAVVRRGKHRYDTAIGKILELLGKRLEYLRGIEASANDLTMNF